jgi:nucleotide-binding universal stress UspA family protein
MAQTPHEAALKMEGCMVLAPSTFRWSDKAVEVAMEKFREIRKLMVVYVVDIDVARYFVGVEDEASVKYRESCESEMPENAEKEGRDHVATIAEKAEKDGIEVKTLVRLGEFAAVCLDLVDQVRPSLIATTRSRGPAWVKKFFGAPVDELIAKSGCPVVTA